MNGKRKETVTVSSKGQIVIPAKMREEIGIHEGDKLVLVNVKGTIQIQTLSSALKQQRVSFIDRLDSVSKKIGNNWPEDVDAVSIIQDERR